MEIFVSHVIYFGLPQWKHCAILKYPQCLVLQTGHFVMCVVKRQWGCACKVVNLSFLQWKWIFRELSNRNKIVPKVKSSKRNAVLPPGTKATADFIVINLSVPKNKKLCSWCRFKKFLFATSFVCFNCGDNIPKRTCDFSYTLVDIADRWYRRFHQIGLSKIRIIDQ